MPKSRDHKRAMRRRELRQQECQNVNKERFFEQVRLQYANGGSSTPSPSLVEALAKHEVSKEESFQVTFRKLIHYFSSELLRRTQNAGLSLDLPDDVVSFLVPLDFYVPLPEGYNAMTIQAADKKVVETSCITVTSRIVPVGTSSVKTTYLIISICSHEASQSVKPIMSCALCKIYERGIMLANHVIAGIQAIPTRHNHYMHGLTVQSSPSSIPMAIFSRQEQTVRKSVPVSFHQNPVSEILQARPLDKTELQQFAIIHTAKTFTDDKIFQLISKFNEAVNMRCFGYNGNAIILADSFVELSLGYLFYTLSVLDGQTVEEARRQYADKKGISQLLDSLRILLNYNGSMNKFKIDIGHKEWRQYCRKPRNGLAHSFLTVGPSGVESLDAIYYAGEMVRKICAIAKVKVRDTSLIQKLTLLEESTSFARGLGELDHDRRLGKTRRDSE